MNKREHLKDPALRKALLQEQEEAPHFTLSEDWKEQVLNQTVKKKHIRMWPFWVSAAAIVVLIMMIIPRDQENAQKQLQAPEQIAVAEIKKQTPPPRKTTPQRKGQNNNAKIQSRHTEHQTVIKKHRQIPQNIPQKVTDSNFQILFGRPLSSNRDRMRAEMESMINNDYFDSETTEQI